MVGTKTFEQGSATLFFDARDGKFTLVHKLQDGQEVHVLDCVARTQWGRTVMLFGHATNTGGYRALGHGTLNDKALRIKLSSGHMYRMDVDPELAHLQPFVQEKPQRQHIAVAPDKQATARKPKTPQGRGKAHLSATPISASAQPSDDSYQQGESEDLTEEDLRRLRGEIPIATRLQKRRRH